MRRWAAGHDGKTGRHPNKGGFFAVFYPREFAPLGKVSACPHPRQIMIQSPATAFSGKFGEHLQSLLDQRKP